MPLLIDFALAWRLLTVIPLPFLPSDPNRRAGFAATYYPLVGVILGLLLAGVDRLISPWFPVGLTAALILTLWAGLTGLLHLDGFMDCCDGLLPPRHPTRRLEIMKDSRVGAFGVAGAILLLLIKFNALTALPELTRGPALLVTPALARWAMVWAMARYRQARREGAGAFFTLGLGWTQLATASVIAVTVALTVLGWWGALLLAVTWLTTTLVALLAMGRISGLTGDVYGAIGEVTETVLLVVIAAIIAT